MKVAKRVLAIILAVLMLVTTVSVGVSALSMIKDGTKIYVNTRNRVYAASDDFINIICRWKNDVSGTGADFTQPMYCVEYGKHFNTTYYGGEDLTKSPYWQKLTELKKRGITYTTIYGFNGTVNGIPAAEFKDYNGDTQSATRARYVATQVIIWEFLEGYRNLEERTNTKLYNTYVKDYPGVKTAYDYIARAVKNHKNIPNFCAVSKTAAAKEPITLKYNTDTKKYTYTKELSDYQVELYKEFTWSIPTGCTMKISGNTLTITSSKNLKENVTISGYKTKASNMNLQSMIVMQESGGQTLIYGQLADPVNAYTTLNTDNGMLDMTKYGYNDEKVGGCTFNAFFDKACTKPVTVTGAAGQYTFSPTNTKVALATGTEGNYLGRLSISWLPAGTTIYLKEVKAPAPYLVNPTPLVIKVTDGVHTYDTMTNTEQYGNINITKIDGDTDVPLKATFSVTAAQDIYIGSTKVYSSGDVVGTITTDGTTGKGSLKKVPLGKYKIKESVSPEGYEPNTETYTVTIKHNANVTTVNSNLTVKNYKAATTGGVRYEKIGEVLTGFEEYETEYGTAHKPVYETQALTGCVYGIYTADNDQLVAELAPNKTYSGLAVGKYYLKEIKAPTSDGNTNYLIDTTEYPFEIKENNTTTVTIERLTLQDERQKFSYTYEKLLENGSTEDYNAVVFGAYTAEDIFNADGEIILTKDNLLEITTPDGTTHTAQSTIDYPICKIYLKELATAEGYILSDTVYPVEFVSPNNTTALVTVKATTTPIENKLIKGTISVIKTDDETTLPIEGVEFEVKDVAGAVVATLVTDADGHATSDLLPYGTYTVTETKTGEQYILDSTPVEVNITESLKDYVVEFTNDRLYDIRVLKIDEETEKPLSDCKVGLYDADGELIAEKLTDENGEAIFTDLTLGNYFLQELEAPKFYVLDDTKHEITVNAESAPEFIYEFVLKNKAKVGSIVTEYEEKPSEGYDVDTVPQVATGDWMSDTYMIILIGIIMLSVIVITLTSVRKKKEVNK